jgi:hypothetical protein
MMMLLNLNAAIRSRFNESILLNDPYNWCWPCSGRVSTLICFGSRKHSLSIFDFVQKNSWRLMYAYLYWSELFPCWVKLLPKARMLSRCYFISYLASHNKYIAVLSIVPSSLDRLRPRQGRAGAEPQIGEEAWPCDTTQAKAIHIDANAKNHRSQHIWRSLETQSGEGGEVAHCLPAPWQRAADRRRWLSVPEKMKEQRGEESIWFSPYLYFVLLSRVKWELQLMFLIQSWFDSTHSSDILCCFQMSETAAPLLIKCSKHYCIFSPLMMGWI